MTVREQIEQAYYSYNKGNWDRSFEILGQIKGAAIEETMEIMALFAWNYWKKGSKSEAAYYWTMVSNSKKASDVIKASTHAGLGIYCAEKGDKEEALRHIQLAQNLLPENATIQQNKNLNACGITMAKIGELERAEEILKKVAGINEQLMKSDDSEIAREATLQKAKNGYNLVSLVYIPQERFYEAIKELEEEVISRYEAVEAETDLAAAYHRVSEVNEKIAEASAISVFVRLAALNLSLSAEQNSLELWKKHQKDAPGRVETAQDNIKRIENKMREQE